MTTTTLQALQSAQNLAQAFQVLSQKPGHSEEVAQLFIDRFADRNTSLQHISSAELKAVLDTDKIPNRNLQITQGYHDLTIGMTDVIGAQNISWVGFATWASKTAGIFIRHEEIPEIVQKAIERHYREETPREIWASRILSFASEELNLRSLLTDYFVKTIKDVGQQIGEGNTKVYKDLAPLFARAIEEFTQDEDYNENTINAFCDDLRPGSVLENENNQGFLRTAFRAYYEARFEEDLDLKAEKILLANAATGLHEQVRLQSAISNALTAPTDNFLKFCGDRIRTYVHRTLHPLVDLILMLLSPIVKRMEEIWLVLATELMMTMKLPNQTLHLGRDLPTWPDGHSFPVELSTIEDKDLESFIEKYDKHPSTLRHSGARRWDELGDRMNYILDLFRSNQQNAILYTPPFTPEQREEIYQGKMPRGDL